MIVGVFSNINRNPEIFSFLRHLILIPHCGTCYVIKLGGHPPKLQGAIVENQI